MGVRGSFFQNLLAHCASKFHDEVGDTCGCCSSLTSSFAALLMWSNEIFEGSNLKGKDVGQAVMGLRSDSSWLMEVGVEAETAAAEAIAAEKRGKLGKVIAEDEAV